MKIFIQASLFLALTLSSFFANAGRITSVPEIGIGSAAIGFGLLAGLVALMAEKRRK